MARKRRKPHKDHPQLIREASRVVSGDKELKEWEGDPGYRQQMRPIRKEPDPEMMKLARGMAGFEDDDPGFDAKSNTISMGHKPRGGKQNWDGMITEASYGDLRFSPQARKRWNVDPVPQAGANTQPGGKQGPGPIPASSIGGKQGAHSPVNPTYPIPGKVGGGKGGLDEGKAPYSGGGKARGYGKPIPPRPDTDRPFRCPRCNGFIPTNEQPGQYPGAWSRHHRSSEKGLPENELTIVCSACGQEEAFAQIAGTLVGEKWPMQHEAAKARAVESWNIAEAWVAEGEYTYREHHQGEQLHVAGDWGQTARPHGITGKVGEAGEAVLDERTQFAREHIHQLAEDLGISEQDVIDRRWRQVPRPIDLPYWRNELVAAWAPEGPFSRMAPAIFEQSGGYHRFLPWWEYDTFQAAGLWFVGRQMCDLLLGAAPTMPDTRLRPELMPDGPQSGFVVFEKPLASLDATGVDVPVTVGAYLWGPAVWADDNQPILGITVYGPMVKGSSPYLMPLGNLVWPFGQGMDDPADAHGKLASDKLEESQVASMAEDRRRLMALWVLSSQPGVANVTHIRADRAERRRAERERRSPDVRIRVITLRAQPKPTDEDGEPSGREYHHRWMVSGHWRNQAFGPKRAFHRPVYINPYLKGPEGAPFLGGATVKYWRR